MERKLQIEIGKFMTVSREKAAIKTALPNWEDMQKLLQQPGQPGQVLATIYGNVAITRQELGEFLITRYGGASLELLLNRKIIDKTCKEKGITVSDEEVASAYSTELKRINVDEKKFVDEFLLPNGKTLYEWKEDVLRPKLMMMKLTRQQTKVTEEDLHMAFDALYGEKIEGRLILWKADEQKFALSQYSELRDSDAAFVDAAKRQFNPSLAAKWGAVPAFARNTTGIPRLEEEAFKLQPGEVTALIELPEGFAIFKCDKRIPPQVAAKLDDKRQELTQRVIEPQDRGVDPGCIQRDARESQPACPHPGHESTRRLDRIGAARPGAGTDFVWPTAGADTHQLKPSNPQRRQG